MRKRALFLIVVVLVVGGLAAALRYVNAGVAKVDSPTATALPAAAEPEAVVASAKVVPARSAALSFATSDRVVEVLVQEGDAVQAGQLIARLARERAANRLARAEAQLAQAQATEQQLREGASEEDLAAAEAQLAQAQAQLGQVLAGVSQQD